MADTKLPDYPARLGDKQLIVVDHTGPLSYPEGGEVIGNANAMTGISTQGLSGIDQIIGSANYSVSGNFQVFGQPTGTGSRKTWLLIWEYSDRTDTAGVTGATVTLGTTPTNGTYNITATTGTGQIQVVVAGGVLSSVNVLVPGVYSTAPTFTPPAGLGTGATIVAQVGTLGGYEVADGTNLTAEVVKLGYIGR